LGILNEWSLFRRQLSRKWGGNSLDIKTAGIPEIERIDMIILLLNKIREAFLQAGNKREVLRGKIEAARDRTQSRPTSPALAGGDQMPPALQTHRRLSCLPTAGEIFGLSNDVGCLLRR